MKLTNYQCFVHDQNNPNKPTHVDVELFTDTKDPIKMCDCSAYMGGMDSFDDVAAIAAEVRSDLDGIINTEIIVKRDILDGSIDIFRAADNVLLFSMECEDLRGADWVPTYDSTEG